MLGAYLMRAAFCFRDGNQAAGNGLTYASAETYGREYNTRLGQGRSCMNACHHK